jgi:hypothetical protein
MMQRKPHDALIKRYVIPDAARMRKGIKMNGKIAKDQTN